MLNNIYLDCECNLDGIQAACDENWGHCWCKDKVNGTKCDKCDIGYFQFPTCKSKLYQQLIPNNNCYQTKSLFQNVIVMILEHVHVMSMANAFAMLILMVQDVKDAKMGIICIPNA